MAPWLRLFRIRLLPTALSNLLVGISVVLASPTSSTDVSSSPPVGWAELPLVRSALMAAFFYMFGMGLNDWRDRKRDAILYPDE